MGEPGIVRPARRPPGWCAPGPAPLGAQGRPELTPAADEDLCFLSGDWRLFQKRRGHRWSLDDLVTAWVATASTSERASALAEASVDRAAAETSAAPAPPARALDLGCGLGSVLLMVAWRLPHAQLLGVEAQADRAALGRRSIAYNGAAARCQILDGDLRALDTRRALAQAGPFALITGTPPYFPRGTGTESTTAQVAPCRFELRGGVEEYLTTAAPLLAPGGRLVVCTAALERARVVAASRASDLTLVEHWDIVPRQGKPVLVMVDVLRRADDPGPTAPPGDRYTLTVRDRDGAWTTPFRAVRSAMGLPPTSPTGR